MYNHIPSHLQDLYESSEEMREWKNKERFDIDHHALNRHDRRVIKAIYRKLKKKQLC